ncbi:hypothetical protein JCM17478_26730 [Thermopirellula anaerolimosa]
MLGGCEDDPDAAGAGKTGAASAAESGTPVLVIDDPHVEQPPDEPTTTVPAPYDAVALLAQGSHVPAVSGRE